MIKKINIGLALILCFSATTSLAKGKNFYVKGMYGLMSFNDIAVINKGKTGAIFGAGVGYYIDDIVRADFVYDHFSGVTHRTSDRRLGSVNADIEMKANINTYMANIYMDIMNAGPMKCFAGIGLGMAQVDVRMNYITYNNSGIDENLTADYGRRNRLAYSLYLGLSGEVAKNTFIDLTGYTKNLGQIIELGERSGDLVTRTDIKYETMGVSLGIRYNI